jgi:photosystem II stability/assembly factor-like uncharacterized protein
MKKVMFVLGLIASLTTVVGSGRNASAETFGCQASPKIGDTCTKRVSIRLRKVESTGRDEFDRRFEPAAGWAIQDCDTRGGERGRTGEVSGPNCVEVQVGSTTTSSSYVQSQANRVYETIQKGRVQGGKAQVQAYSEIENRARAEFSDLATNASVHQSRNYGLQISAWVAVRGGCKTRAFGECINWGPGGSLNTDVIIRLVYVGTNQDVDQLAAKYLTDINRLASVPAPQKPVNQPVNQLTMYGINFTSERIGNAVGNGGVILRTGDGGASWVRVQSGVSNNLKSVHFTNELVGHAVGDGGIILRTVDGGTWVRQKSTSLNLNSVHFTGELVGCAAGDGGFVICTLDGGVSWGYTLSQVPTNLNSVYLTSEKVGHIVGDAGLILRAVISTGSGTTWVRVSSPVTNNLTSVHFTSKLVGTVVGESGVILRTGDGGASWVQSQGGVSSNLNSVHFTSELVGTVVGDGGMILRTGNGGASWIRSQSGVLSNLNSVHFTSEQVGNIIGESGVILRTGDGGASWVRGDK